MHRVTVDGFWMDRTPVTNREFRRFVEATGYRTFCEVPPDPAQYPGALPEMLQPASVVFVPTRGPVNLRDHLARWLLLGLEFMLAADIVRTVIAPSWEDIGQLAAVAVIRTFLNFFLERDLEAARHSHSIAVEGVGSPE